MRQYRIVYRDGGQEEHLWNLPECRFVESDGKLLGHAQIPIHTDYIGQAMAQFPETAYLAFIWEDWDDATGTLTESEAFVIRRIDVQGPSDIRFVGLLDTAQMEGATV